MTARIALEQLARVADKERVEDTRKENARVASAALESHVEASGAAKVAGLIEKERNTKAVAEAADAERARRVALPADEKLAEITQCRKMSAAVEEHVDATGAAKVAGLIEKANNVKSVTEAADEERERRVAAAMLGTPPLQAAARRVTTALKVNTRFKLAGNGAKARAKAIEDDIKRRQKENVLPKKTWARARNASAEGLYRARKKAPMGPRPPKRSWKDLP